MGEYEGFEDFDEFFEICRFMFCFGIVDGYFLFIDSEECFKVVVWVLEDDDELFVGDFEFDLVNNEIKWFVGINYLGVVMY